VVAADTGELTGFEALLRLDSSRIWRHLAGQVRALAEDARADRADRRMGAAHACREAASAGSNPVRVAVNVSPEQLHSPNFVTVVASALAQGGPRPTGEPK